MSADSRSEDRSAWLARVSQVQRERATPHQMAAMRAKSEASRRSAVMAKKAGRMQRSLQLSSSAWSAGMQSPEVAQLGGEAAASRGRRSVESMTALSAPTFMRAHAEVEETLDEAEAAEDELEERLAATAQMQVADGTLSVAEAHAALAGADDGAAQATQEQQLAAALAQLVSEPGDAAACAAKFELYEQFAKLTEDARNATLEMWGTAQEEFAAAPAVRAQIERDIKAIDRTENLGIVDDPRRWFVHGMCQQACRNQRTINGVLGSVSKKLELLASQTECPICFEAFDGDACKPTALGCAHKACESCWAHWVEVRGPRAECPLCRHADFLEAVLGAAPA